VDSVSDISKNYAGFCGFVAFTCSAVDYPVQLSTNNFTQEVRLASKSGGILEWLVGGFFTHESNTNQQVFSLFSQTGQPLPSALFNFSEPSTYQEEAVFGDLTWHVSSKFDATGGLRYAHNQQESTQIGSGLFIGSFPTASSSDGVVTYLANSRYHFSENATGYLRYATGYRPGGPNFVETDPTTGLPNGPATFKPDRLQSYEGGFKAQTADGRFGIDMAIYDINWSDIQIAVVRGGLGAIANAPGGATIRGSELTLTARPAKDLALSGAFAFQDARLNDTNTDLGATRGERLPNVPRFTAALNADYQWSVGDWVPKAGATVRNVGDRTTSFDGNSGFPQYNLPQYTVCDLRAGLTIAAVDLQLYAHNVFDNHGQLGVLFPQFGNRVAILQPRTIGISAITHF
jgi:outer membrane receptor protein involved in Fe transport